MPVSACSELIYCADVCCVVVYIKHTDFIPFAVICNVFTTLALFTFARIVKLWKEDLGKVNKKAADSLADPSEYENLFPEFQEALQAEQVRFPAGSAVPTLFI